MLTDEQLAAIRDHDIAAIAAALMCVGDDVAPETYERFIATVIESQKDVVLLRAEVALLRPVVVAARALREAESGSPYLGAPPELVDLIAAVDEMDADPARPPAAEGKETTEIKRLTAEVERQQHESDRLRRYLSHDIHWKMLTTSAHLWGWGALYPHEKAPVGTPCYISPKDCDRIVDAAVGKLRELIAQRLEPEAAEPDGNAPIESAPAAPCCGFHNVHCEPPSELCCGHCGEVRHPEHAPSVVCVLDAARAAAEGSGTDA